MDNMEHLKAIVRNCEAEGKSGYDHFAQGVASIVNSIRDDAEAVKRFCLHLMQTTFNPDQPAQPQPDQPQPQNGDNGGTVDQGNGNGQNTGDRPQRPAPQQTRPQEQTQQEEVRVGPRPEGSSNFV
jgi:hypothetical protein